MTFGNVAPYVIGLGVIIVAVGVFVLVRMTRRGS